MILQDFEFETAKISDDGKIEYFLKQGKYLDLEIDPNTVLTLVLASNELLEIENQISKENKYSVHKIHPSNNKSSFLISKYPITQKQWYKVMQSLQMGGGLGLKKPMLVSWVEAEEFCDRLSQKEGKEYRLPYESEWEFACRAGSREAFSFGKLLTSDLANFGKDSSITGIVYKASSQPIMEVGMFPPNSFGIYDMHGNVWEWCKDNKPFPNSPSLRIVKGGAYYSKAENCDCSYQGRMKSRNQDLLVGFRVVSSL